MAKMTAAQEAQVAHIQSVLPTFLTYQNMSGDDSAVLLMDPAQPGDVIAVEGDGVTNEFVSGEWRTGWES